jgi:prophage maintenance system killer protein
MKALTYLTVQDILWTNLRVTGNVQTYRFADLEEATYYQYAYGGSSDVLRQAERFLTGFVSKAPLGKANTATAFVGFVAFLRLNSYDLKLTDANAASVFEKAHGTGWISDLVAPIDDHHGEGKANVRAAITSVLDDFAGTIKTLSENS